MIKKITDVINDSFLWRHGSIVCRSDIMNKIIKDDIRRLYDTSIKNPHYPYSDAFNIQLISDALSRETRYRILCTSLHKSEHGVYTVDWIGGLYRNEPCFIHREVSLGNYPGGWRKTNPLVDDLLDTFTDTLWIENAEFVHSVEFLLVRQIKELRPKLSDYSLKLQLPKSNMVCAHNTNYVLRDDETKWERD